MCDDSKKTTTSSSNSTATSTPNVPSWIGDPAQDYAGRINGIMQTAGDGSAFVAPASGLQQQAFGAAGNLGAWQDTLKQAMGLVGQATSAPAPTYAATGYGATGYNAAPAAQVTGFAPALIGQAAQIKDTGGAAAGMATASLIKDLIAGKGIDSYFNPYIDKVVSSTLDNLDVKNGGDLASFDAQSALNKSFGGSGAMIGRTNLVNSQALGRASTEAGLRSDAFNAATALAGHDADNLTHVSETNAANQTQAGIASAQIAAARATAQAQLEQAVASGNQNAINDALTRLAAASNTSSLDAASRTDAAAAFGAGALNTASQFGASAINTASKDNQASMLQRIQTLLSGGQLMGSLGTAQQSGSVSDLSALLGAGNTERSIDADQRTAPLNLAATLKNLLGYDPSMFIGKTATSSSNSKATVTDTPSLLDTLGKILQTGGTIGSAATSGNASTAFNTLAAGG